MWISNMCFYEIRHSFQKLKPNVYFQINILLYNIYYTKQILAVYIFKEGIIEPPKVSRSVSAVHNPCSPFHWEINRNHRFSTIWEGHSTEDIPAASLLSG